jgi:hypothetical protein
MKLDWDLSSLAQAFTSFFPSIHMAERLYIRGNRYRGEDDTESMQWLDIFRPFTAVKSLYVSKDLVKRIACALQESVEERVTDALPSLERLYLETDHDHPWKPIQEAIEPFVAARQPLGHAIVVSPWDRRGPLQLLEPSMFQPRPLKSAVKSLLSNHPEYVIMAYTLHRSQLSVDLGFSWLGK